jgi:hypothetical protein
MNRGRQTRDSGVAAKHLSTNSPTTSLKSLPDVLLCKVLHAAVGTPGRLSFAFFLFIRCLLFASLEFDR